MKKETVLDREPKPFLDNVNEGVLIPVRGEGGDVEKKQTTE